MSLATLSEMTFHDQSQKSSPRNIPALPLEIIDIILREASKWPFRREERQVLTACTLVCKSWLPLAQRLLYHSVIVEADSAVVSRSPGRLGLEALLQRSHLLGFTRSLSIRVLGEGTANLPLSSKDDFPKGEQKRIQIPDFFVLLAHSPHLQYLKLSVPWAEKNIGPFEPHIQDWLSSLVLPIEALEIDDGGFLDRRSTFVYDLVSIWPTIRALRLHTSRDKNGLPQERSSISLREPRLSSNDFSATVIEWLLPPPPPNEPSNLQFLGLCRIPEEARVVLSVHGPSVSTLRLVLQPTFEIDHLFTKLEELVIAGPSWSSPLPALPKTLKHIRLVRVYLSPDDVVAAVAQVVPILPDLRIISIEEEFTASEYYLDLQKACEAHRVEILVSSLYSFGRTVVSAHQRF